MYIYIMAQIDTFEALADPTRRRIIEALRDGERQVGDIVPFAGVQQSGVSRHLKILSDAGFVAMRPDGQRRLYSLRPDRFREIDAWLEEFRIFFTVLWEARLDRISAAIEKRRAAGRAAGGKEGT